MIDYHAKHDIMGNMEQLVLLPSDQEAELMGQSARFRALDDIGRRFVCAWLLALRENDGSRVTAAGIGERAGIGKTKAYEMWKKKEILQALREASQAHSDSTDVLGSMALDILVMQTLQRVVKGKIKPEDCTPGLLRMLTDCKVRLGVVPGSGAIVSATDPSTGRSLDVALGTDQDAFAMAQEAVSKLQAERERRAAGAMQGGSAESVRVESEEVTIEGELQPESESESGEPGNGCNDRREVASEVREDR